MTTLSRQIAEAQRKPVRPPAGTATAGKGAAAPGQPVPAVAQPARLDVNVTQVAAPVPEWLQAYRVARSISWAFILLCFVAWTGSKVF